MTKADYHGRGSGGAFWDILGLLAGDAWSPRSRSDQTAGRGGGSRESKGGADGGLAFEHRVGRVRAESGSEGEAATIVPPGERLLPRINLRLQRRAITTASTDTSLDCLRGELGLDPVVQFLVHTWCGRLIGNEERKSVDWLFVITC